MRFQCFEQPITIFNNKVPCIRTLEQWYLEFQCGCSSLNNRNCEPGVELGEYLHCRATDRQKPPFYIH